MLLMNQMKQICGALFLSTALAACGGGGAVVLRHLQAVVLQRRPRQRQ